MEGMPCHVPFHSPSKLTLPSKRCKSILLAQGDLILLHDVEGMWDESCFMAGIRCSESRNSQRDNGEIANMTPTERIEHNGGISFPLR